MSLKPKRVDFTQVKCRFSVVFNMVEPFLITTFYQTWSELQETVKGVITLGNVPRYNF